MTDWPGVTGMQIHIALGEHWDRNERALGELWDGPGIALGELAIALGDRSGVTDWSGVTGMQNK